MRHDWDRTSFVLHLLLAVVIISQLTTSLLFDVPYQKWLPVIYWVHKAGGFVALILILIILIQKFSSKTHKWRYLFPWSQTGCAAIAVDIKGLCQCKLPQRSGGGLPGFIQGLGVLLILAMGLTGSSWFLSVNVPSLGLRPYAGDIIATHSFLSTFVWIYLAGHVGMALLHRLVARRLFIS